MKDTSKMDAAGVARACSRALKAAGWSIYKRARRNDRGTPGLHCYRVGYSNKVAVTYMSANPYEAYSKRRQDERRELVRRAKDALREKGYPVADDGYIHCRKSRY